MSTPDDPSLKRIEEKARRPHWISAGKDLATIVTVIIALVTLAEGLSEYSKQGTQQRAEHFLEMRHRFKDNEKFRRISALLEQNDDALTGLSLAEKTDYVGFFEEIALLTNSGLVRPEVAHYMFGYYAIQCWENEKFWRGANRDTKYWSLFRDFVLQMMAIQQQFEYRRSDFRL